MNFNNAKMMRYTERILKRLTVYQENRELGGSYELFYLLVTGMKRTLSLMR